MLHHFILRVLKQHSSKDIFGLGGLDVYSAKATVDGWTIKNMGAPLSASFDDLYFIKAQNGTDNYLASNVTLFRRVHLPEGIGDGFQADVRWLRGAAKFPCEGGQKHRGLCVLRL